MQSIIFQMELRFIVLECAQRKTTCSTKWFGFVTVIKKI